MFERFTDRARKVIALANQEAQRFHHEYMGTQHILLGLVKEGNGVGATVLKNLDVDLKKLRIEAEKSIEPGPDMITMGKLPQTPRAKNVIEYAIEEARALNHKYVGTEHILLGLLRETEGMAAQILMNMGLKLKDVRQEVLQLLGAGIEKDSSSQGPFAKGENQLVKAFLEFLENVRGYPSNSIRLEKRGLNPASSAVMDMALVIPETGEDAAVIEFGYSNNSKTLADAYF